MNHLHKYFKFFNSPRQIFKSGIILLLIILSVSACTIESKIAKEYISKNDSIAIMFIRPAYLYLTSLKDYEIDNKDELDEYTLDSTLISNSLFLQHLDQEEFIHKYNSSFIAELKLLGFDVFTENQMDTFLTLNASKRYLISIAQLELEEYVLPIKDEEIIEGALYYKNVDLNAVNVNSWFDLTKMNDDAQEQQILFTSHYIIDDYESHFKYYPFTGDVSHSYNIDSIVLQDIYYLGSFLGSKYAGYIYDYLMNMFIYNNLPDNISPGIYYHYDRRNGKLYPVYDDRFIPMED